MSLLMAIIGIDAYITDLLGMGEESWLLIQYDLFRELSQWRDKYARLMKNYDKVFVSRFTIKGTFCYNV